MDDMLFEFAAAYLTEHKANFSQYIIDYDLFLLNGTLNIAEVASVACRDSKRIAAILCPHSKNRLLLIISLVMGREYTKVFTELFYLFYLERGIVPYSFAMLASQDELFRCYCEALCGELLSL